MRTEMFKAEVNTPLCKLMVAVLSNDYYAKADIGTAVMSELKGLQQGQMKIGAVTKSNKRILRHMNPIANCLSKGDYWAWVEVIK